MKATRNILVHGKIPATNLQPKHNITPNRMLDTIEKLFDRRSRRHYQQLTDSSDEMFYGDLLHRPVVKAATTGSIAEKAPILPNRRV